MAKVGDTTNRSLVPAKTDQPAKPAAPQPAPAPEKKSGGWLSKLESSVSSVVKKAEGEVATVAKKAEADGEWALKKTEAGINNGIRSAERAGSQAVSAVETAGANALKKADATVKSLETKGAAVWDKVEDDVEMKADTIRLSSNGVLSALVGDVKHAFDFVTDKNAFNKVSSMTPEQLASCDQCTLAKWAKQLLDPTLGDKLFGVSADKRSEQALRLLTAHGDDAGAMQGIISRMPYLHDTVGHMKDPAKTELVKLLDKCQAKPGDWSGFDKFLDKATGSQVRAGTQVTPLINGSVAFPQMYQAIDNAKSTVNLSVYAFQSDDTGWDMAKHLAAAADRGVAVRVIYDPMGSKESNGKKTQDSVYEFMRQHGVQVIAQQPSALADHLTHRKITVVDGSTAFTGGMNVGDEYAKEWHDVHSKIEGPGVADLQKLFIEQWKGDGGKVTPQDVTKMMPALNPVAQTSARIIGHEGSQDQNIKLAYLRAIDTAQTSVKIASPYFSDPDVMQHLQAAAKRGVDVTVVVPQTNDMQVEQNASRANYAALIAAGVKVYEYHGAPMAHDKVATFDGKMSTIGSSNLDARSLGNNDEANVWTGDPNVAKQLEDQLFAHDITQSERITPEKAQSFLTLLNKMAKDLSDNL